MLTRDELHRATLILTEARLMADRRRSIDAASITVLGETASRLAIGPEVRKLLADRVAIEIDAYLNRSRETLSLLGIEPDFEPDPPKPHTGINAGAIVAGQTGVLS